MSSRAKSSLICPFGDLMVWAKPAHVQKRRSAAIVPVIGSFIGCCCFGLIVFRNQIKRKLLRRGRKYEDNQRLATINRLK
jgi:hypothetical protein